MALTESEAEQIRSDMLYLFGPVGVKEILFYDVAALQELAKLYTSKSRLLSMAMGNIEDIDNESGSVPEEAARSQLRSSIVSESLINVGRE